MFVSSKVTLTALKKAVSLWNLPPPVERALEGTFVSVKLGHSSRELSQKRPSRTKDFMDLRRRSRPAPGQADHFSDSATQATVNEAEAFSRIHVAAAVTGAAMGFSAAAEQPV